MRIVAERWQVAGEDRSLQRSTRSRPTTVDKEHEDEASSESDRENKRRKRKKER